MKTLTVTIKPQLGPRKTDPHDPTPQFDQANRLTIRLRAREVATLLFWFQGQRAGASQQASSPKSIEVGGNSYKFSLARQDSGTVIATLSGMKLDGTMSEPLGYELQPHQQVQFNAFLENALFGFWNVPSF